LFCIIFSYFYLYISIIKGFHGIAALFLKKSCLNETKIIQNDLIDFLKSNILLQDVQFNVSHLPSQQQQNYSSTDVISNSGTNDDNDNNNMHEFLLMHLTKSFDNIEIKKMYADFKSRGGIAADLSKKRLILNETENTDTIINNKYNNIRSVVSNDLKNSKNDCLDIYTR